MRHLRPLPAAALSLLLAAPALAQPAPVAEVLGVNHTAGRYNFTEEDFLNEGAERVLELGSRVIKVWFTLDPESSYPFNSEWEPPPETFVELAETPYYRELFARPFETFILVVPPATGKGVSPFLDGMTEKEIAEERAAFYRLARHLLREWAGSGKTFILQNWEGDHLLRQYLEEGEEPGPARLRGLRDWWNARQDGVERARREVKARGVEVFHAIEVNLLARSLDGEVTATNDVVPQTRADLYSYSSWDLGFDRDRLIEALDHLAAKAPDSPRFGDRNVYLGEFGAVADQLPGSPAEGAGLREVHRGLFEAALGWGVRYALFWQIYCNGAAREYEGRPTTEDLRGFWLVRPDGSRVPLWDDFQERLEGSLVRASLALPGKRLVTAEPPGEGTESEEPAGLVAQVRRPGPWAVFTINDLNGGALRTGDVVFLQAHDGRFLTADAAGEGGAVAARAPFPEEAEPFTVLKLGGRSAAIGDGDVVAFRAADGRYLSAPQGGGPVRLAAEAAGRLEAFRLVLER
jgi:hypothetical protein